MFRDVLRKFCQDCSIIPMLLDSIIWNLSLHERRISNGFNSFFKIIHGPIDVEFDKYFLFNSNHFNTRDHSKKLYVVHSRLDCRKFFFCNRVIKVWNSLPASIVNLRRFDRFKIVTNSYILRNYCSWRALMSSL